MVIELRWALWPLGLLLYVVFCIYTWTFTHRFVLKHFVVIYCANTVLLFIFMSICLCGFFFFRNLLFTMAPSLHFLGLFFFYFSEHLICFAKQWKLLWKLRTRSLIFCLHHKNFCLSVKFPLITVMNCTAENVLRDHSKGQLSEMRFFFSEIL